MQEPKKTSKVGDRWNQLKLACRKWAMNEQNAQAQKKLYNKTRSMLSRSLAVT